MRESMLPEAGENLFAGIKKQMTEAEANGIKLWKLSIGQPTGAALLSARQYAAQMIMLGDEDIHEYQDNTVHAKPDFAERFALAHTRCGNFDDIDIDFLPIPGIKPMLGLIPLACGGIEDTMITLNTLTDPGYPTPEVWANKFTKNIAIPITLSNENGFVVDHDMIDPNSKLLMVNFPHNPSGKSYNRREWAQLCRYCSDNDIRLFNDAAYAGLTYDKDICTLADVAIDFPNLSWAEAYSASKSIANGTGWRVGAMAGSPDFIDDIGRIKGETDSGLFAPAALGALYALENDQVSINNLRQLYFGRIRMLEKALGEFGMRPATEAKAGFFTLWKTPSSAFGEDINDAAHFNNVMIANTGIVGVPFGKYIRYAVVGKIEDDDFSRAIYTGFKKANVKY